MLCLKVKGADKPSIPTEKLPTNRSEGRLVRISAMELPETTWKKGRRNGTILFNEKRMVVARCIYNNEREVNNR